MKLSVVIPALNEEKYIGDCLKSVLREIRRSRLDAEVLVVDNASTDNTAGVASGFCGVRVVSEPQRGLTSARQRGFLESSGELIANLDADTRMPRGWAEKVIREFERDRSLVCLSGPFVYFDLSQFDRIVVVVYYCFVLVYHLLNQYVFKTGAVAQGGNFTVRRTALAGAGGFNTDIVFYGEDSEVAGRLAKVGRVRFSFRFPIATSGRRLKKEGVWRTGYLYIMNNFFHVFYGKLYTKSHTNVRDL
jgi:glycosyltransferase involved in cell wall biosynthesis